MPTLDTAQTRPSPAATTRPADASAAQRPSGAAPQGHEHPLATAHF